MKYQFRIWSSAQTTTELNQNPIGAPHWDPIGSRLGIFNNRSSQIEWYPRSLVNFIMNMGQKLQGRDNSDTNNPIVLDWDTPTTLRIINTATGTVLASFTESINTMHNMASIASGQPGLINKLTNAGASVQRALLPTPPAVNTAAPSTSVSFPYLLAPNWYAWKTPGSPGDATFQLDYTDVPSGVGAWASCKITAVNAPTSMGLRHYSFDYPTYTGRSVTCSAYMRGPVGSVARIRLVSEMGGEIGYQIITGDGTWHRNYFTVTPPPDGSRWLALDSCHRPGMSASGSQHWAIAAPQINETATLMPFETRSNDMERTLLRSTFKENALFLSSSAQAIINLEMCSTLPAAVRTVSSLATSEIMNVASTNPQYMVINSPVVSTIAKVMSYIQPFTSETN